MVIFNPIGGGSASSAPTKVIFRDETGDGGDYGFVQKTSLTSSGRQAWHPQSFNVPPYGSSATMDIPDGYVPQAKSESGGYPFSYVEDGILYFGKWLDAPR